MCECESPNIQTARHSCAHLMAAAIQTLWPGAKFGVGPATKNGFFYDVLFPEPIGQDDLQKIEARMRELRKKKLSFERSEVEIDHAISLMDSIGQNFKVELLNLLKEKGSTAVAKETGDDDLVAENVNVVSLYKLGDFVDLCRGPHIHRTDHIGAFKLTQLAGAYWRGNERNPQLQRIYGLCFDTKEELTQELWRLEQAKLRDHRRLGKDLQLFTFSQDVGSGLPIWLPKGTVLRDELTRLAREEERREGYQRVITPIITKEQLYYRSGHLPYYKEDMYQPMDIDGEKFYLRPMNCPHHHQVFLSHPRSYRDLPLRIAEYGDVYRYEASGALSGLMRTRGFCQNDAHIYCREDQAKDEFVRVMRLHARYYDLMGIKEYYMRLSLPDLSKLEKYVNEPEKWLAALAIIREAMNETGLPYVEVEGEAAFYGPKIDFMIKSVIGTEYAISTNQLDFLATERFDLTYTGEDGQPHSVYVIHRAPLGSHERFTAFLIEHYAGAFPTWLAPNQLRVIPISDRHLDYARKVVEFFFSADVETATGGLRIDVDDGAERMQKKIRNAQIEKIPYILVVGDREAEDGTAAVRLRNGVDLGTMSLDAIIERIRKEVVSRQDIVVEQSTP
ncbi:threonine--tRNA ligase [Rhodospirillum sp. A1_3_36]|uniref:threonine--tRNA ligase n=1 Tax=Rhodospirillum sp. A1_3_36 TaxID=3391666 RepID=UPI0039A4C944